MTDQSTRAALIDRIQATRRRWGQLVDEVDPDRMEEPGAMGDWTFKDVAAHLTAWRRRTVGRLEAAARGEDAPPPPWPADLGEDEDDPINAWIHDRSKDRPLGQILAEADGVYDELIAAVVAVPDDALHDAGRFPWLEGQALADTDFSGHLDEHEPDVRRWLKGAR
jgi:Protein of unknown function (DUF1706)